MRVETFTFDSTEGWSTERFPEPDDPARTLVLAFAAPKFFDDRRALDELVAAYPGAIVTGCSTAGEIGNGRILDGAISVVVASFDSTSLRLAEATVEQPHESFGAGVSVAKQLEAPGLTAVFILAEGLSVNGSELLRGMASTLDSKVIITGGLAGDADRFARTWVLVRGAPTQKRVVAVGLYGDTVHVRHGSRGGWDKFGPERTVTKSEGSVLYELDGQPALQLYKNYLGDRAVGLPATALLFPLALKERAHDTEGKTLVRTILKVDEDTQSMTFAGDVPQGSCVQLMRANFDRLIEGASDAGRQAAPPPDVETFAVAISCVGRRIVLGERTEEEVEATLEGLAPQAKLVGFYSYGEVSPFASGECADLHNQTMTVTSIWEH